MSSRKPSRKPSRKESEEEGGKSRDILRDTGLFKFTGRVSMGGKNDSNTKSKYKTLLDNLIEVIKAIKNGHSVDKLKFKLYDKKGKTKLVASAQRLRTLIEDEDLVLNLPLGYIGTEDQLKRMTHLISGTTKSPKYMRKLLEEAGVNRGYYEYMVIDKNKPEQLEVILDLFGKSDSSKFTDEDIKLNQIYITNWLMYRTIGKKPKTVPVSELDKDQRKIVESVVKTNSRSKSLTDKIREVVQEMLTDSSNIERTIKFDYNAKNDKISVSSRYSGPSETGRVKHKNKNRTTYRIVAYIGTVDQNDYFVSIPEVVNGMKDVMFEIGKALGEDKKFDTLSNAIEEALNPDNEEGDASVSDLKSEASSDEDQSEVEGQSESGSESEVETDVEVQSGSESEGQSESGEEVSGGEDVTTNDNPEEDGEEVTESESGEEVSVSGEEVTGSESEE